MVKRGRPSKFDPAFIEQAHNFALLGATAEQMASFFDVAVSTFDKWLAEIPAFSEAVKRGRLVADGAVVKSLYHRANGYSHRATKFLVVNKEVQELEYTEHYPPDAASMIFWLKNRQPQLWRERQALELTGANGGPVANTQVIAIADLNPEQREQMRAILLGTKRKAPEMITDVEHEEIEDGDQE